MYAKIAEINVNALSRSDDLQQYLDNEIIKSIFYVTITLTY